MDRPGRARRRTFRAPSPTRSGGGCLPARSSPGRWLARDRRPCRRQVSAEVRAWKAAKDAEQAAEKAEKAAKDAKQQDDERSGVLGAGVKVRQLAVTANLGVFDVDDARDAAAVAEVRAIQSPVAVSPSVSRTATWSLDEVWPAPDAGSSSVSRTATSSLDEVWPAPGPAVAPQVPARKPSWLALTASGWRWPPAGAPYRFPV